MQRLLFSLAVSSFSVCIAQNTTLVKACTKQAIIWEGTELRTTWTLSPELRPDTYQTSKSPGSKQVRFYTDIDSLLVNLKAGEFFNFIVLLNGKDSCITRIECPPLLDFSNLKPETHDTIPFELTDFNNIKLKVLLDEKDTLFLKFDSGTRDFLLTRETIKTRLHLQSLEGHRFKLGKLEWINQNIFPVELSGQGTEGRFGWNLFDGMLVEINYTKRMMIIHSRLENFEKAYEKYPIDYIGGLFCITADLEVKHKKYRSKFLFDTGYQRTVMMDQDLVQEQHFPKNELPVLKRTVMKNGQGLEIPVLTVNADKLLLSKVHLKNIPVQLLSQENPAGFKVHILGNEILKRFDTVLDFQKNVVYLKTNVLLDEAYAEQAKKGS